MELQLAAPQAEMEVSRAQQLLDVLDVLDVPLQQCGSASLVGQPDSRSWTGRGWRLHQCGVLFGRCAGRRWLEKSPVTAAMQDLLVLRQ